MQARYTARRPLYGLVRALSVCETTRCVLGELRVYVVHSDRTSKQCTLRMNSIRSDGPNAIPLGFGVFSSSRFSYVWMCFQLFTC